jgi:AbrB family looped-hinge helix DNA binding protein
MTVRVSSKGQIVIPKPIREQLKLDQGADLQISVEGDRVVLEKANPEDWRSLRGSMKGSGLLESLMADRAWERSRD